MKRLDINKDGIIDLCELHAFFGFPNCTFCCSCTPCSKCGICCCHECLPDIPCYLHKCVHHQSHSPLETKTICKSPLRDKIINVSDILCPKYNNENININNISNSNYNYEFNTLCNKYSDLDFKSENNTKYDNNYNNSFRKFPDIKKAFVLESNNIEFKNDYNSPHKRYSSPKKYYINSQSDFGSTLYSTSPMNDNFSQTFLSKAKSTLNNNNTSKTLFNSFNSYSNSFRNINKNEFGEEQFKEYLKTLMVI